MKKCTREEGKEKGKGRGKKPRKQSFPTEPGSSRSRIWNVQYVVLPHKHHGGDASPSLAPRCGRAPGVPIPVSNATSLLALASTLGQFGGGGPRLAPFARPPPAHPSVSHQALPVYLSPVLVLVLSATVWIRLPSFPLLGSLHSFLVLLLASCSTLFFTCCRE